MKPIVKSALLLASLAVSAVSAGYGFGFWKDAQAKRRFLARPKQPFQRLGTTFVITHAKWRAGDYGSPQLGPPWRVALEQAHPETSAIRTAAQWDQVTNPEGRHELAYVINRCDAVGVPVILCIGLKTPRWPEVYAPEAIKKRLVEGGVPAIKDALLSHSAALVEQFAGDPRVEGFQIENEPLEPFGDPAVAIPLEVLRHEVGQARRILQESGSKQYLMVTMGAGLTEPIWQARKKRPAILAQLLSLPVDRVGFNIYQKGYTQAGPLTIGFDARFASWELAAQLVEQVKAAGKTPVLAEIQGEPWEADPAQVNLMDPYGNPSLTPDGFREVFARCQRLGAPEGLVWGAEFHIAARHQGNSTWYQTYQSLLKQH